MSNEVAKSSQISGEFNFFNPVHFETMQRVCKMFANSELVPDMYKVSNTNPIEKAMANCMIAIEMAGRIGASPLMIMQNMVIIYGRPSWSSKFLIATVNSCGRFEPLEYSFKDLGEIKDVKYTEYEYNQAAKKKVPVEKTFKGPIRNIQCIAHTSKKGRDTVLESIPVTIEMAIQEGWYTKNGSKWQTMEKLMLTYRSASFWTSAYAPELSMGIKTTDEIIDMDIQDIDHEEIIDKEAKQKANKKPMSFDKEPEQPSTGKDQEPENEKPDPKKEDKKPEKKPEPKKEEDDVQFE